MCIYAQLTCKSCSPSVAGKTLCVGNREGVVSIWCAKVSHSRARRNIQISWLAAFAIGRLLLHFWLPKEGVIYNFFIKNGNWLKIESEKVKLGRDLLWLLTKCFCPALVGTAADTGVLNCQHQSLGVVFRVCVEFPCAVSVYKHTPSDTEVWGYKNLYCYILLYIHR